MGDIKTVFSFGAGVQSTAILLKVIEGALPRPDHIVFADTQAEPRPIYDHLENCRRLMEREGMKLTILTAGDLHRHAERLPFFVINPEGGPGMLRRQCTYNFKVRPIEAFIHDKVLGLRHRQRYPREHRIDQWIGISTDEARRRRESERPAIRNCYPLIDQFGMSRVDCLRFLLERGPAHGIDYLVPKSSCYFCPYRADRGQTWSWSWMKKHCPEEFEKACRFDEAIRELCFGGMTGIRNRCYIHRQRRPLREVRLEGPDASPADLMADECYGMCGN